MGAYIVEVDQIITYRTVVESDSPAEAVGLMQDALHERGVFAVGDVGVFNERLVARVCEACGGKGWLIQTRDDGLRAVERCDLCAVFASDEDAAMAAREAGVRCLAEYPCFVADQPIGRVIAAIEAHAEEALARKSAILRSQVESRKHRARQMFAQGA